MSSDHAWHTATVAALSPETLYALLRLRSDVFVVEQEDPYSDLDGRDLEPDACHLWLEDDQRPIAYLRILAEPDGSARIGRVAVAPDRRGEGLGRELLTAALEHIGARRCVLAAQAHQAEFYARFGFVPSGPEYSNSRIPHLPMERLPRPSTIA